MSLYKITESYAELQAMAESGEVDAQTIADTLEGINGDATDKIANTLKVIENLSLIESGAREEAKRLQAIAKARKSEIDRLRDGIALYMSKSGQRKIKTMLGSPSFQKGRFSLKYDKENAEAVIPPQFLEYMPKVLTKELTEALNNGEEIEGVTLERGEDILVIR
jgi:malonyl CoA-acyl carrier protein transacylase